MSKKNNQKTRVKAHTYQLKREKEAQEKKEAKAQRKQEAEQEQGAVAKSPAARGGIIIPSPPNKLGVAGRKFKRKGIRLRKNHMVRGIRIKDASSKQKVKDILAAEEAMRDMMVDDEMIEDAVEAGPSTSSKTSTKKSSKKVVLKKKKGKEPKVGLFSAPAAMKLG